MKTKVQVTCSSNDQAFRRICGGAKALMGKARTPGAALGIYHNGREHYAGLGVTSMDNPLPVTPDTLFQIGSISKTFLVTIVLMLAEKGKLNINLPVRRYLPKLKLNDNSVARRVTLRDLFTHSGGWDGDFFKDFGRGEDAVRRITEDLSGLRQVAPLGKFWSYNNSGFYIAGRVVEVVTGKPYEKVVQEMLFDPLGMKNSFFFAEDVLTVRCWARDGPKEARGGQSLGPGPQHLPGRRHTMQRQGPYVLRSLPPRRLPPAVRQAPAVRKDGH
jgi:CubicO group peptidase (beta-lactamase class C family)